jgi:hypothetical protein
VLWIAHPVVMHVESDLLYSVETGNPAVEHLYKKSAFECFGAMPEVFDAFNAGMTAISKELAPAILKVYDFSGVRTLMDIGGGHGYFICAALRKYPHLRGVLLDLPAVVEGAKCAVCDLRLDDRCEPLAGNMFEHIPPCADAYFMQHILHDWDDERACRILENARQALAGRAGGRLIVVDCVLPQNSRPHLGKLLDLRMLLLPGGRERTEPEWRALFAKAGFAITAILPTQAAESVIEAAVV